MENKQHPAVVCDPKQVLNLCSEVTNCCQSLRVKYSAQKLYMTGLVSSLPVSTMSRNPGHNPPSCFKENSTGQSHHQEELIHKLAMQLRKIGDSIDHENRQQEGREVREPLVIFSFGGVHVLLRFFWNDHLL